MRTPGDTKSSNLEVVGLRLRHDGTGGEGLLGARVPDLLHNRWEARREGGRVIKGNYIEAPRKLVNSAAHTDKDMSTHEYTQTQ